jgi:hypothetical protein
LTNGNMRFSQQKLDCKHRKQIHDNEKDLRGSECHRQVELFRTKFDIPEFPNVLAGIGDSNIAKPPSLVQVYYYLLDIHGHLPAKMNPLCSNKWRLVKQV